MNTTAARFAFVLSHFHCPKEPRADRATACCPAHDDDDPSLSIRMTADGTILLHCWAGCDTADVVAAAGLVWADLFPEDQSAPFVLRMRPPPVPRPAPKPRGERVRALNRVEYQIRDAAGVLRATKHRTDWLMSDGATKKSMLLSEPNPPKDEPWGLHGKSVTSLPLFGSHLRPTYAPGTTVGLVEGEKSAQSLLDRGVAAMGTVTGAGQTPDAAALAVLAGFDVVLWPDNDAAGVEHMQCIGTALLTLPEHQRPASVRWFAWRNAPEKGDAADWTGMASMLAMLLENAPAWTLPVAPVSGDTTPTGDGAEKDRIIAAQTEQLIEQAREIAHLEDRLRHQVRVSEVWRVHAKKRQALYLQTLRRERAQLDADRVPLFRGRQRVVRELASAVGEPDPADVRADGFVQVHCWRVQQKADATKDLVSDTIASLREKNLIVTDYVTHTRPGGGLPQTDLYVKREDGLAGGTGVLEHWTRIAPPDKRTGKKGKTHGGVRPSCRRCGPDAEVVLEVTKTWRCTCCNTILESHTQEAERHRNDGRPLGRQVASLEIPVNVGRQLASLGTEPPVLRPKETPAPPPVLPPLVCAESAGRGDQVVFPTVFLSDYLTMSKPERAAAFRPRRQPPPRPDPFDRDSDAGPSAEDMRVLDDDWQPLARVAAAVGDD